MYNEEYFYGITDLMHFNVYASLLKEHIIKEERVIIKVFKKNDEIVVIETNNFKDTMKSFINGVSSALPTILLVLMASSIKYILEEGMIIATIANSISALIDGKNVKEYSFQQLQSLCLFDIQAVELAFFLQHQLQGEEYHHHQQFHLMYQQ